MPEVETVVRTLRPQLAGAVIAAVWSSGKPLRLNRPLQLAALQRLCVGARVAGVRRRAKYILMDLTPDTDTAQVASAGAGVLFHLGMSGRLRLQPGESPRAAHTHVVLRLGDGRELRFVDPRRFGCVRPARQVDALPELAALGPDPLHDLDADTLRAALASSRAPIKAFLLDQRRVAGLGNIYVCEALFQARVHPATPSCRVRGRAQVLLAAIKDTLITAIGNRGTTLRDYVDAAGAAGDNAAALLVYGREGGPCRACATPIRRVVQSARSTFLCPQCQRR